MEKQETNNISGHLLAGTARMDITPTAPCHMGGFAGRDHGCEGVHDRLYATSLAISREGKTTVITAVDILALTNDQMDRIWNMAGERLNLKPDQLFINCSHTHAGPEVHPAFNCNTCAPGEVLQPDPGYIDQLLGNILLSVEKAIKNLEPAEAFWNIGETFIGINRRAPDKSLYSKEATGYENFPNPDGVVDRSCPVILFKDKKGKPLSLIFGAACHPTTMRYDNYLISAEYPGVARQILEKDLGGAPALFLQGMAGDVKPRQVAWKDTFRSGTFEDIEIVGKELAADVRTIMEKGLKPLSVKLQTSLKRVTLPFDKSWGEKTYKNYAGENQADYRRVWAKYWLKKLRAGEPVPESIDLALSIVELSPELRFTGIAGELLTDMGMKIKHQFNSGNTLVFGYTNGEIAYITDAKTLKEGGYEATETVFFSHDKPAPFSEEIEEIILTGFKDLEKNIV
jgi:hypothetical protein